jgi:hypothetical protein
MRFLALSALLTASATLCPAQEPCSQPVQWAPCDFAFTTTATDPAGAQLQLHAEFRSPRHKTYLIPAFHDGGNRYVIRLAPPENGEWTYRFTSNVTRWNSKEAKFTVTLSTLLNGAFIRNVNVHHWQTIDDLQPHLWMGAVLDRAGYIAKPEFDRFLDTHAEHRFNHLRVLLLGEEKDQSHAWPNGQPNAAYFQELDRRLLAINQRGIVVDLVLADTTDSLKKLFPTWQQREQFVRYVTSRYAGYNLTWQVARAFEGFEGGRPLTKEMGLQLRKHDQYDHTKSPGAAVTSTPLLGDQWMNYITSTDASMELGSVEHQLYVLPFINTITPPKSVDAERRALWNSTMNGAYPVRGEGGSPEGLKQWKIWRDFFAGTRFWELEPYFYVDGGRAVALVRQFGDYDEGIEYIVYIEKPGPLEVSVKRHGYDARWFNPATGEIVNIKDFKAERFTGEPPTKDHDWVLHLSRDGRKEGLLKSYKFESRPVPLQEVETQPRMVPFEMVEPSQNDISISKDVTFSVKIKRDTRGTRSMMYLWTGEVVPEGHGFRVLATGKEGTFRIPKDIIKNFPGVLSLRLAALNANGKIYYIDKIFKLVP